MAIERLIHCVGLSEEDIAHLRLLLRSARKQSRDVWNWGSEARADLVVVNQRRLLGDSARRRALQREIACAQVLETDDQKPAGPFLRKPFKREAVVALLNSVGRSEVAAQEVDSWSDPYQEMDLGEVDLSELEADRPGSLDAGAHRTNGAAGPATAGPMPPDLPLPEPSRPGAESQYEKQATAALATMVALPEPVARPPADDMARKPRIEVVAASSREDRAEDIDADAEYPLIDYLQKKLLREPARIALPGVPSLMIDASEQLFLAQGALSALESYARHPLRYGNWQRLTPGELDAFRRSTFTKPCVSLIWMCSFIHSRGFLSKKFDSSGTFRLVNRLNLAQDYPRAFRVGAQMTTPRRLHEIARLSTIDIDEVFNIVNAYDAIGYVEGTLRGS
jgi:hypothetical protein